MEPGASQRMRINRPRVYAQKRTTHLELKRVFICPSSKRIGSIRICLVEDSWIREKRRNFVQYLQLKSISAHAHPFALPSTTRDRNQSHLVHFQLCPLLIRLFVVGMSWSRQARLALPLQLDLDARYRRLGR